MLLTTVVGSYPQPAWLIDRDGSDRRHVPRVRARDLWRISEPLLEQAQDDATVLAVRDMERAGIDVVADGEIRRESWSNHFATALEGIDLERPGTMVAVDGRSIAIPRVVGPIRRIRPIQMRDAQFLRRNTDQPIKVTLPGPFSMTQTAHDDYYRDERALALDFAAALNGELKDLLAADADVLQIDEPFLQRQPEKARAYGIEAINHAFAGVGGTTALHLCFGYARVVKDKPNRYAFLPELEACTAQQISLEAAQPRLDLSTLEHLPTKTIVLGALDLGDPNVETAERVASRIRAALQYVPPERLILAPDCGMKYLPREVAFGKLRALVLGRDAIRAELRGSVA